MKPTRSDTFTLGMSFLLVLMGTIFFTQRDAEATILTFSITNGPNHTNLKTAYPDYGDRVNSISQTSGSYSYYYAQGSNFTPNILVDYDSGGTAVNSPYGMRYYNDNTWPEVAFFYAASTPNNLGYFIFTPDPTYGVRINSFDLFRFGAGYTGMDVTWSLRDGATNGTILTSGSLTVNGFYGSPNTISPGFASMNTLVLEINQTGGAGDGLGLDNLNFDQIPEPSAIVLLAVAGMFGWLRRIR